MIHQMKKNFSPGIPVEVRTKPMKGIAADCEGIMKLGRMVKIVITINSRKVWEVKCDCLIHEWAHAMEWEANWTDDSPKREHGATWGVWYSKIYEHIYDKCWEDMKKRGLLHRDQMNVE
jgi:hypothetical protein